MDEYRARLADLLDEAETELSDRDFQKFLSDATDEIDARGDPVGTDEDEEEYDDDE